MAMNNPETIARLLRHIATGTRAQENKHDIIFIAAAELLEDYERLLSKTRYQSQYSNQLHGPGKGL